MVSDIDTTPFSVEPAVRPAQVCITADIEFSIGGAFAKPQGSQPISTPAIVCSADGGKDYGLGFILDTLDAFGLQGTFFVEALNCCYFGDRPMAAVAERIMRAGHDVQLHLHPCWLFFRDPAWQVHLAHEQPNDSCAGRSDDELDEFIGMGLEVFRRWGVPRPVAMRVGNMQADRAVYRAMARQGLRLASNIGCAIWTPTDPSLRLFAGRHWVEGVLELPVLSYVDVQVAGWRHRHCLTITGSSSREIAALLQRAASAAATPIVLLTHAFEFVNHHHERFTNVRPHRTNRSRLVDLCRMIADNPGHFAATTFAAGLPEWTAAPGTVNEELQVPLRVAFSRMLTAQIDNQLRVR